MAKNKVQKEDEKMENVQEALSRSEAFIEKYRNQLLIGIGVVVIVVLAIILFRNYYLIPKNTEAQEQMLPAVAAFEADQYELALRGDEANIGFADIVDDYSLTSTAELASFYAGVCAYHLGEYEEAVSYLKKVDNGSVNLAPAAKMLLGDSYVALEEYGKAVKCFKKAAKNENQLIAPKALKKAGLAYEKLGKYADAVKVYTEIKDKYFQSQEAMDIDKYIARANAQK